MAFLIVLIIVVVAAGAYYFRVPLLAKILGQPEDRIRRQIGRKR